VATHLSLKLQRDLIRRQAMTDALTGLPNRRQFEQELARQWQQALRHDRTLALLVIDIDYFKQYNDHYGHVAGDACLQQVAQAMQAALRRPYDLLARYGGEEFVVLLAETGLDGAMQVAQALLTAVTAQAMPHTASLVRPYISISIGVAAACATAQQSAHDLLQRADQQLYAAKAGGRARASAGEVAG
jgi:diguanylate cyclase (GGDEF)-like protein